MNVLIPGGAGYIGALLVPQLLANGHNVTVYDTMYFGNAHLPDNDTCRLIRADIRDHDKFREACVGQDAVIYFASISNETACQRAPELAQSINVDAFEPCVRIAKQDGIRRFIYASSVAVYGSSDEDAKEDAPLEPTTIYAKGKAACESILRDYQSRDFATTIARSASVCGYSPHQRLDLTANMMAHHAARFGKITVAGGEQKRSHIHIADICAFYRLALTADDYCVSGQTFNVAATNESVMETAETVKSAFWDGGKAVFIEKVNRTDDRSYTVDPLKASLTLGFVPKRDIFAAAQDMRVRFVAGYWPDSLANPNYMNLMPA